MANEYAIALSRFGLTWNEFLDLTPKEFYLALKDDLKQKEEEVQAVTRSISETIRRQTMLLMNLSGKSLKSNITPEKMLKYFPFPWDKGFDKGEKDQTRRQMVSTMKAMAGVGKLKKKKK